jgi:hypothetical protein
VGDFAPLEIIQTDFGVHPSFYPKSTGGYFPGVKGKRPIHKADSVPLPRGEVTNTRSYITPPHIILGHSALMRTVVNYIFLNPSVFCADILKHFKVNIIHCFNSEIRFGKKNVLFLF